MIVEESVLLLLVSHGEANILRGDKLSRIEDGGGR